MIALCFAQSAQSATLYWKGGSGGSEVEPKDLNSTANWTTSSSYSGNSIKNAPSGVGHTFNFRAGALTYLVDSNADSGYAICSQWNFNGGDCVILGNIKTDSKILVANAANNPVNVVIPNGTWSVGDVLSIGQNATGVFEVNGGNVAATRVIVGNSGDGTLTINGGTVETTDSSQNLAFANGASTQGTINLNGGTLETTPIVKGSGTASIVFGGGTLKAKKTGTLIPSGVTVTVGEGGGTIDNGGYATTIAATLSGTGGMTFKGNGKTTLDGDATYSGQTYVTAGTTLVAYMNTTKNKILDKGLVVVGVPNVGDEIFIVTRGPEYTISAEQLAKVSCPLAPTTTFALGEGNTNIVVKTVGLALENYWTGAANDGDLSNAANWANGVPSGNANIFCTTNSMLTKGEMFAPISITFIAGSAAATINCEFSGITQIANNSANTMEFKDAVAFSGNVDVVQNTGVVKFTGGATGVQLARATNIHGTYNFTKTGDLTEIADTTVKSDGVYNLPNATFYKHNGDFHVEAGGKAEVKNAKIKAKDKRKLLGRLDGEFKVADEFLVSGNGAWTTHSVCDSGSGTFIANTIRVIDDSELVPPAKTIIGSGGIVRDSGYVLLDGGSYEFGSYGDWTMYYETKGINTATTYPVFYKKNNIASQLTFDTSDYYDNTIGRTITCEAQISAKDSIYAKNIAVTVKGKGTFVFANTSSSDKIFAGGLTVQDTATVKVNAGCTPGHGVITLGAGTTLALTSNSREFTPLANTLKLPTEGTAKLRIDGKRLRSGEHAIAAVDSGANIILDSASTAIGERKAILMVKEDGKLYLSVEPAGTRIIIR